MSDAPAKMEWLRSAALGISTSVVLIFIGYWLNSWLSRDHLSIEYVRFVPKNEVKLPLPTDMEYKLRRVRAMPRLGNSLFSSNSACSPLSRGDTFDRTGMGGLPPPESVRSLQNCLEALAHEIKLDRDSLQGLSTALDKNLVRQS